MTPSIGSIFIFLVLLGYPIALLAAEWDANNYPNPTTGGFKQCNMRSASSICDPDQVLTEQQRYRLNNELTQLEARTRQEHGSIFCEKKGITGAIALVKHVKGGSQQAVQVMANRVLEKWNLDRQCQKAIVIVHATDDRKFWIARRPRVPVDGQELTNIFVQQKDLLGAGDFNQAYHNILAAIIDSSLAKQGPGTGPAPGGGDRGRDGQPQPGYGDKGGKGGAGGFKLPFSTGWLIAIIVLVVIPLLCCCCCIYLCCCRNKDGNRRQGPTDTEGGGGQPFNPSAGDGGQRGGRQGGGFNFGGIFSGLASGAAGNAIMNAFRNRGGGGRGRAQGGGQPPAPYPTEQYDDGKRPGLYPSVPKADEGGGGSY